VIVIDIGCATYERYPDDESISKLVKRFRPKRLIGYDPAAPRMEYTINKTRVDLRNQAAWTYDGEIGWYPHGWNGLRNRTGTLEGAPKKVRCIDIASTIIDELDARIVVKMDAEGAEYTLIPYLHEAGADALIELLLVEWHGEPLDLPLRCPVEEW
jgi:hypothetical protein